MSASHKAVILGGGGILGAALIAELSAEHAVIAARRTPSDAAEHRTLDLADASSVASFINSLRGSPIRVLIHNAADVNDALIVSQNAASLAEHLDAYVSAFDRIVTSLRAELSGGSIVVVSSLVGISGARGQSVYAAVKGSLIGYVREKALTLAEHSIRINAVLPGLFRSRSNAALSDEAFNALVDENVLGHAQDVHEVARFIRFLCGMKNVSGQVFNLDSRIR